MYMSPSLGLGLTFDGMFRNGAVLQAGVPVRVWGNASARAGTRFMISLDSSVAAEGKVSSDDSPHGGKYWEATLPAQSVSWSRRLQVALDGREQDRADVLYGQVVLCSGQSNMGMPVAPYKDGAFSAANGTAEAAAAGRYTDKIKILTLQTPFPHPTLRPWNGSNCGAPNINPPKPDCVPTPQWNDVLPGPNGKAGAGDGACAQWLPPIPPPPPMDV